MNLINVENLCKSFGDNNVVNDISFSVPKGEIFGFLGPNGAGKTTTLRLLNGLLTPSSGKIIIKNNVLSETTIPGIHSVSGVVTDTAEFYDYLTGYENISFFGNLFGIKSNLLKERSDYLFNEFELLEAKNKIVKNYSTGMKKRLKLIRAFLNNPEILYLDEPTSGLDPEGAKLVNDYIIKQVEKENVTVFLCTHQLKYAQDICSLYGFIDNGSLIAFGTFDELRQKVDDSLYLEIRGKNLNSTGSDYLKVKINNDADAWKIISEIFKSGGEVIEAKQIKIDLEELYFKIQVLK
ncbi:MAG TPA: ABC transporter ATP-binding protein [Bacteroidetes bacterium]|nr:ABC transporter ATP-binding protein [Bacteroidota bacterium]HCN38259.1 ABC transporter ATP-binding protein [Bacteroidota bacterium]